MIARFMRSMLLLLVLAGAAIAVSQPGNALAAPVRGDQDPQLNLSHIA